MNGQPTQPHRIPAGLGITQQQQPPSVGTPPCPTNSQPAPLQFFQNSPVDTRTKSKNGQGIKQSKSLPADKPDVNCWRCKQPGHLKRDCPYHRSVSSADRKAIFHISATAEQQEHLVDYSSSSFSSCIRFVCHNYLDDECCEPR